MADTIPRGTFLVKTVNITLLVHFLGKMANIIAKAKLWAPMASTIPPVQF